MNTTTLLRRISLWATTFTMAFFGLTGAAYAQTATITNTGPNSKNSIISSVDNACDITNTNNVASTNYNNQQATTGDASSSQNTGTYWQGWSDLNPTAWQANGSSFADWWSAVSSWVTAHNNGNNWNSTDLNLSWAPTGTSWNNWDPMTWQTNGQSYNNWNTQLVAWLNSSASNWMLTWTTNGTGMPEGAVSGDATNSNSSFVGISIINTPTHIGGYASGNPCGTAPTGGMGGGGSWVPGSTHTYYPTAPKSSGGYGGSYGGTAYYPTHYRPAPKPVTVTTPAVFVPATLPAGGSGGGAPAPSTAAISSTGPSSQNTIDSTVTNHVAVTNTNTVVTSNSNSQSASSGNASSSQNTSTGGAGSGAATNGNAAGSGVGVVN